MTTISKGWSNKPISYVLMGTNGTAGDILYISSGSAMTYKSLATGTDASSAFIGVLEETTATGSYAAVQSGGVVQLEKHAVTNKIEINNSIYGTKSSNKVGTVAGGTAIGVCVKQSATTDTYVDVELLPCWITGAGGLHA